MDFSAAEKDRGVKFCVRVRLLSGQVFSYFGEFWQAWSHGGGTPFRDEQCGFLETKIEVSGDAR